MVRKLPRLVWTAALLVAGRGRSGRRRRGRPRRRRGQRRRRCAPRGQRWPSRSCRTRQQQHQRRRVVGRVGGLGGEGVVGAGAERRGGGDQGEVEGPGAGDRRPSAAQQADRDSDAGGEAERRQPAHPDEQVGQPRAAPLLRAGSQMPSTFQAASTKPSRSDAAAGRGQSAADGSLCPCALGRRAARRRRRWRGACSRRRRGRASRRRFRGPRRPGFLRGEAGDAEQIDRPEVFGEELWAPTLRRQDAEYDDRRRGSPGRARRGRARSGGPQAVAGARCRRR